MFSKLRVWNTAHNNGVLIYVPLADHVVEIVAGHGIHARAGERTWSTLRRHMEAGFSQACFESAKLDGIREIIRSLAAHFPSQGANTNELPKRPVLLGRAEGPARVDGMSGADFP